MLDITYPIPNFGIDIIKNNFVLVLYLLANLNWLLYRKLYHKTWIRALSYFFGIMQLLIIPIGTYSGVLLIKDLRYDLKKNNINEKNEMKEER
jgi:hypothetical protein